MTRRLPVIFILSMLVIDFMGIGLILPVMPDLIRDVNGGDLANAAIWGGVLAATFGVMQFLFGPALGSLSDRFGRRPIILISLGVLTIDYLAMATANSIWLLLVARVIGGITAATSSTAAAFMADISKPEEKAANFGLISAAFGVGFVLGPVFGGLLGELGTRAPFYAAAVLAGANFIFGYAVLPETVTDKIRRPFEWRRANPLGALMHMNQFAGLLGLLALYFLYQLAFTTYPAVWAYFTQEQFGWSKGMVGLSLGLFGIAMALVQAVLIRQMLRRMGENWTVRFGLVFSVISFICVALIPNGTIVLFLAPISALGAVVSPAIQGIMSRTVADDSQGELQGVLTSLNAIAMILAQFGMTWVFFVFARQDAPIYLPGAPFLLAMALILVALAIFLNQPRDKPA